MCVCVVGGILYKGGGDSGEWGRREESKRAGGQRLMETSSQTCFKNKARSEGEREKISVFLLCHLSCMRTCIQLYCRDRVKKI